MGGIMTGFDKPGFNFGGITDLQNTPPVQPTKTRGRGGFLTSLISEAGGTGGAMGGAALGASIGSVVPGIGTVIGGLIGAGLGGFAGGAGGRLAENKIRDNRWGVGDALKEGAISGVMSAGPLRLLKGGAAAANALRAGAEVTPAIEKAVSTSLLSKLTGKGSEKLADASEKMIAKQFRLNPNQQFNFEKATGEKAIEVLKRNGIQDAKDILAKAQPLQEAFDKTISSMPALKAQDLEAGLKSVYEPLKKSPALFQQNLGAQLEEQAKELLKQASNGTIEAGKVNELRKVFDQAVKYTQKGAPENNVLKETADALRGVLQKHGETVGAKVGKQSFKDAGMELSKLYRLNDVLGKQEYLGTGNKIGSLSNLLAMTAGGASGGPVGAGGVLATEMALNSKAGKKAIVSGLDKGASLLSGLSTKEAAQNSAANIAKKVIAGSAARSIFDNLQTGQNQSSLNMPPMTAADATTMSSTNPQNVIASPYTQSSTMSNASDSTPGYGASQNQPDKLEQRKTALVSLMLQDLQKTGGKNASSIALIGKYLGIDPEAKQNDLTLSDTAIARLSDYNNAMRQLGSLGDTFSSNPVSNPLIGKLRGMNKFDTTAQTQQSQIDAVRQIVGKALEGGVLRKEDEAKYAKILPTLSDTPTVAKNKIKQVMSLLQDNYDQYLQLQKTTGKGAGQSPSFLDAASLAGA